jgi:xylulokinase
MGDYLLAYDLGTGGNKASLYDAAGACVADTFVAYETLYPRPGWHEQRPADWWNAVVASTRALFAQVDVDPSAVAAIGISGHSLGVVPLDAAGNVLLEATPIWSDTRPDETQLAEMFANVSEADWYHLTGNGFPANLYSIFKILWYRDHQPDVFGRIDKVIGTKDYINFRLTGRALTDYSYASGSGVYDLAGWQYSETLINASNVDPTILPEIVASTEVIGTLTARAAEQLGLPESVKVVAGGVDNSCMALGAKAYKEGRMYNSLGSSSWIAVASAKPVLDVHSRPYVFTHVVPGMFTSAMGIFSAGTSFRWVRDTMCADLVIRADAEGLDVYELMTAEAADSPLGANGLMFNPSLAGGNSLDASQSIRGAMLNLDLGHTRADAIRASMEGIALGLRVLLDELGRLTTLEDEMLLVGGGARSGLWRQIYADAYRRRVVKTNIDQQAAALGAAAVAAVGAGVWSSFDPIDDAHQLQDAADPVAENAAAYDALLSTYRQAAEALGALGETFHKN